MPFSALILVGKLFGLTDERFRPLKVEFHDFGMARMALLIQSRHVIVQAAQLVEVLFVHMFANGRAIGELLFKGALWQHIVFGAEAFALIEQAH